MSYLVLARKYRPQTFADVVGQQHVTRTIANAIAAERIHHAFLFCGARGVGKTTTARLLAKNGYAIGCQYPYVRSAARFAVALRSGLVQHGGDLSEETLAALLAVLRERHPSLEVRVVPRKKLFRSVDILLPGDKP